MAPKEKTEIVDDLERCREEFLATAAGLSEEQAKTRPDPARWSVLDCVEHVTFVEERFLNMLNAAGKLDAPRIDKQREANLTARIPDRSTRINAPEAVVPTGRFATLEQALDQFKNNRARTIQFAQDRCDDLYLLDAEHARFGKVNGMEFLLIISNHARRHAAQIREVRSALGQ